MRRILLVPFLYVPALLAQSPAACDLVKQGEANALLGGASNQVAVGAMGCNYANRPLGVRLTITVQDWGASAKTVWDGLKGQSQKKGWLAGEEGGMGSNAYAELIKRSAQSSAGKSSFVVVKGTKILVIAVTDDAEKQDIAGKKEMLDKLRPVARQAVERL